MTIANKYRHLYQVREQRDKLSPDERMTNNRLVRWARLDAACQLLPDERVAKCFRVPVKELIDIIKSPKHKRAHYSGTVICGSVWLCAVCSAKITEGRRVELQSGIDKAIEKGLHTFMVTPTLQHSITDKLSDLGETQTKALRKTKSGRWYQEFKKEFEIIGNVIATEITFGFEFGWHYHKHIIFFSKRMITQSDCEGIKKEFYFQYSKNLSSLGRYAHPVHGVDVRASDSSVADYVAKYGHEKNTNWSLAAEATKGLSKNSIKSQDNLTPLELLDYSLMRDDEQASCLFQEYAAAMKGKRQLRWSPGLRELLGLGIESTDEELAQAQDEDGKNYAQLTRRQLGKIIWKGKRGEVLEVASTQEIEAFQVYLQSLGAGA